MNLVTQPWIPVVMLDGSPRQVSLFEAFSRAAEIRDVACNPPQRIALMRLLICIAQAALDGPRDEEDWYGCKEQLTAAALRYLKDKSDCFELFGDRPFMQVPGLSVAEGKTRPFDELDCRLVKGNMSVLFDHEAASSARRLAPNDLALALITLLSFSPGGKIGQCIWNGVTFSGSTFAAPCIDSAMSYLRADHLLATIHLNLMTKRGQLTGIEHMPNGEWGKPVWEMFPRGLDDAKAFANAGSSYLGRLVPLSRFVSLRTEEPGRCIIGPPLDGYRLTHLPAFREPWATILSGREREMYLRLDPNKHAWRELGSLLTLRTTAAGNGGPIPLCNLRALFDLFPDSRVDIWVGGLRSGAGGGKLIDMLEWTFAVRPDGLRESAILRHIDGVRLAEAGELALDHAVKSYFSDLKVDSRSAPTAAAKQRFWAELDVVSDVLADTAQNPDLPPSDAWHGLVRSSASSAYACTCPRQTPRQIQAFARGLDKLGKLKKPEE